MSLDVQHMYLHFLSALILFSLVTSATATASDRATFTSETPLLGLLSSNGKSILTTP